MRDDRGVEFHGIKDYLKSILRSRSLYVALLVAAAIAVAVSMTGIFTKNASK